MNKQIAIITDDLIFPKLLEPLLSIKVSRLKLSVCQSYVDIDAKINAEEIDLIIIDGGMLKTSCIEIIHYIRNQRKITAPIWFFPEIKTAEYIYKSKQMGANKIIQKPFDPHEVTDEIGYMLDKKYQSLVK